MSFGAAPKTDSIAFLYCHWDTLHEIKSSQFLNALSSSPEKSTLDLTHFYCPVFKDIRRPNSTTVVRFNNRTNTVRYARRNSTEHALGHASFIRFNIIWSICFAISMTFIVAFLLLAHYFNADNTSSRNQPGNVIYVNVSGLFISNKTFDG